MSHEQAFQQWSRQMHHWLDSRVGYRGWTILTSLDQLANTETVWLADVKPPELPKLYSLAQFYGTRDEAIRAAIVFIDAAINQMED